MTDTARYFRLLDETDSVVHEPLQSDAEAAVSTLLRWIGEDPKRDGLRDTPRRLAKAFSEHFCGYQQDPEQILQTTFEETDGFNSIVER